MNARIYTTLFVVGLLVVGGSLDAQLTGLFTTPPDRAGQRRAIDFDPNPNVVEVVIAAFEHDVQLKNGTTTRCWTYNGIVPGPLIEAKVGDKIIIHFFNFLPEQSSIHWHGVELPAVMDGSHISQKGVPGRGGYFKYEFNALRGHQCWYHPHFMTMKQLERGLYGVIDLRDPAEDTRLKLPKSEAVFVLDDILLNTKGQHGAPWPTDPAKKAVRALDGRVGDTLLVNGSDSRTIEVKQGVPERWRIVNAASARFMRFSIPGHDIYRIGGDGGLIPAPVKRTDVGLVSHPLWPIQLVSDPNPAQGVLLAPGERADIVFTPMSKPGSTIPLVWHDIQHGMHAVAKSGTGLVLGHSHYDGTRRPETLMQIKVKAGVTNPSVYVPPAVLRPARPINVTNAQKIMVMFGHSLPAPNGDVTAFAAMKAGKPLPFPMVTAADAPTVKVGEVRIWEVVNMTGADHPFHAHGFFFQPIEVTYIDDQNPSRNKTVKFPFVEDKDVVIVPRRPGLVRGKSRTILRAAVKFDDTGRKGQIEAYGKDPKPGLSGGWLFHCHVLEHAAIGMMSFVQVRK